MQGPPDEQIAIEGIGGVLKPSVPTTARCVARNSFPSSWITWYLDGRNVTRDATPSTHTTSSQRVTVNSELTFVPKEEDDEKVLKCEVNHETLQEPIVAEETIYICMYKVLKIWCEQINVQSGIT